MIGKQVSSIPTGDSYFWPCIKLKLNKMTSVDILKCFLAGHRSQIADKKQYKD